MFSKIKNDPRNLSIAIASGLLCIIVTGTVFFGFLCYNFISVLSYQTHFEEVKQAFCTAANEEIRENCTEFISPVTLGGIIRGERSSYENVLGSEYATIIKSIDDKWSSIEMAKQNGVWTLKNFSWH